MDEHPVIPLRDSLRLRMAELLTDRYRIVEEIGHGGMAVVYLAENLDFGRLVAIKVLRPDRYFDEDVQVRFRSESIAIAQLQHPHIIGVHARGESEGLLWFEMDYVEGGSLEHLIQAGPIEYPQACRLLAQAAGALHYAHGQGVLHRDIKPGNLLVGPNADHVTVTDFGIAKIVGATSLTETGKTVGTLAYMSPEQLMAERGLTGAVDQYALGVVGYEMLTGARPFDGESSIQLYAKLSNTAAPLASRCPNCPADLELLLRGMLAPAAADRWPTLALVRQACEELAVSGRAPSLHGLAAISRRKRFWLRTVSSAAVVAIAGVLYVASPIGRSPVANEVTKGEGGMAVPGVGIIDSTIDTGKPDLQPSTQAVTPAPPPPPPSAQVTRQAPGPNLTHRADPLRVEGMGDLSDTVSMANDTQPLAAAVSTTATLQVASTLPSTYLYINDSPQPRVLRETFQNFTVPAGKVHLVTRSNVPGCTPREDTLTLAPGEVRRFYRNATCPD